jgi:hypothetical protein
VQILKRLVAPVATCLLAVACGTSSPSPVGSPSASAPPPAPSVSASLEPAGLAQANSIPTGWTLQRSFQQDPGPPVIWVRVYAKAPVVETDPLEGPGRLVAYQAFGSSPLWTGPRTDDARAHGGEQFPVAINGQAATVWHVPSSGELLVAWTLGGKSLALVANSADLSAAQLVDVAQGFAIAP